MSEKGRIESYFLLVWTYVRYQGEDNTKGKVMKLLASAPVCKELGGHHTNP